MSAAKRKSRKKGKIILFAVEIVIILMMLGALYFVMKLTDNEGPKITYIDPDVLEIPSKVKEETEEGGTMHGYMNIALFGLDLDSGSTDADIKTYTDKQIINNLYKGNRSDSIMIASINLDTGDIKLVSVYRDTFLNISTNSKGEMVENFTKCNAAYSYGGAEAAVRMLNMNLDMDITKFVAVNFKALVDVIDALGGIWIDVSSEEEVLWLNAYQSAVSTNLYGKDAPYIPVTATGYQLLNGLQATAYCRIRYTKGDDFQRASRQREVLQAIEAQAKQANLVKLTEIFDKCIDYVYTNIDKAEMLGLLSNILKYRIVAEDGFPQSNLRMTGYIGRTSYVVPSDLEANVKWLHEFFFDDEEYEVTDRVREYSQKISQYTVTN